MEPVPTGALAVRSSPSADALAAWSAHPWPVLGRWVLGALLAALALLTGTLVVAELAPGSRELSLAYPPVSPGGLGAMATILEHNLAVLALHASACVAGFIAGARMPEQAARMTPRRRRVHQAVASGALGFVLLATLFSVANQIWSLGTADASVAAELHVSPALLLLTLLPHALLELTGMFLPLAAWVLAVRRRQWDQLLSAALVSTVLALPVLVVAASWETFGASHLVALLTGT